MTRIRMIGIRHLASVGVVTLTLALGQPASGQWIVFDPNNYAQNLLQAARALQQIDNQITSLQDEARMLMRARRQSCPL
jgi:P-type conjugative transfer protein TrbJ